MKRTFDALFTVGTYLIKGYTLKKEDGARFANKIEQQTIFNSSNKVSVYSPHLDKHPQLL